ncbi:unnamed protein product [Brachionus calyciflorus]|uniref:Sodium/nucleoside cotransporter n=1 Tax=Brachionus calyciflorus TaxID=104777 RepID=A0A813RL89_9BILA|nr:unnamed protein product [Brachionus calyciflorus]
MSDLDSESIGSEELNKSNNINEISNEALLEEEKECFNLAFENDEDAPEFLMEQLKKKLSIDEIIVDSLENQSEHVEIDLNEPIFPNEKSIEENDAQVIFNVENENIKFEDNQIKESVEANEEKEFPTNNFLIKIAIFKKNLFENLKKPLVKKIIIDVFMVIYVCYFLTSMFLSNPLYFIRNSKITSNNFWDDYIFTNNKGLGFLVINVIVFSFLVWEKALSKKFKNTSHRRSIKLKDLENKKFIRLAPKIALVIALFILFVFNINSIYNIISLIGLITYVLLTILLSNNPINIDKMVIVNGLLLQTTLAVIAIRSEFGFKLLKFISDKVVQFLNFTDAGSSLVFGQNYLDHYFIFKACAVIIFFGAMVNFFYYIGLLQFVILKLSFVINKLMGTSPTESVNAAANIFVGQTEAPLIIKPFLAGMTKSEIFAVMVGGFSTASGSVLAAYLGFGVSVNHVIVASLLGAPGSLIIAKTLFPETEETQANFDMIKNMEKEDIYNFFEAITNGAVGVLKVVGAIVANLIACTAFFTFIDQLVQWFFSMINLENFGLTTIFQYLFFPFVFLMGVNLEDCRAISKLIGIKVFVNEFVAYSHMGNMIKTRNELINNGTLNSYLNGTLILSPDTDILINDRSIAIATYSLCGFANLASVGLQIACFSSLVPQRAKLFPKIGLMAMIGGNICNFINACIAGMWSKSEKKLNDIQKCQGISNMLLNNFPKTHVLIFILFGIVLGLSAIGLQIYSIVNEAPLYSIGTGIWVGCLMVLNEILMLILTLKKSVCNYYVSTFFRNFCFIVTTALMAVNINAIRITCKSCNGYEFLWIDYILLSIEF